jgi:ABC-type transporter Mla MlaB component
MCLAVIVESKKNLEKNNGDIKIAVSNFLVKNLFDLTRLSHKLEMHTTVEEAVLAFS